MTNKEIATLMNELASLMEIHNESEFKSRTFKNAYVTIRRYPRQLAELEPDEILEIQGIGKTIRSGITQILDSGTMEDLEHYRSITPDGIREMLKIKGLGPKKIRVIWNEMEIEDVSSLLYACLENRLIEQKGFGLKTQNDLIERIEFFRSSQGLFLFASAEESAIELLEILNNLSEEEVFHAGAFLRKEMILSSIEFVGDIPIEEVHRLEIFSSIEEEDGCIEGVYKERWPFIIYPSEGEDSLQVVLDHTAHNDHLFGAKIYFNDIGEIETLPPLELIGQEKNNELVIDPDRLIKLTDIKGVVHNHSTYSDGTNTLEEMARACINKGYSYFVISDHSKSAFYANGLDESRVLAQWKEIEALNDRLSDLHIFKSIESDILYDGSLDYADDILAGFDLVIASIHSQLRMDEEKAMSRLMKAIENPFTRILGHPTGRLLLGRKGYPVDHKKLIDACSENGVVIELNANPNRLDIDPRWIGYAQEKGVKISINPDAHSVTGIDDIRFGVYAARSGGLEKEHCLNALDLTSFRNWVESN